MDGNQQSRPALIAGELLREIIGIGDASVPSLSDDQVDDAAALLKFFTMFRGKIVLGGHFQPPWGVPSTIRDSDQYTQELWLSTIYTHRRDPNLTESAIFAKNLTIDTVLRGEMVKKVKGGSFSPAREIVSPPPSPPSPHEHTMAHGSLQCEGNRGPVGFLNPMTDAMQSRPLRASP